MNSHKRLYFLASLACLLVILSSCLQSPPQPLRVGGNVWPGYESLYLASDLGYYNNNQIQLVDYPSATEVSRALRNGDLEVAALTLDETLSVAETNHDVRVVLITDVSAGGDAILAKPGIETLAALKGRRVGVESNALGALVITRALEQVNLSPQDLKIVSLGVSEHEFAFKQGSVDAVVTFEPVRSKLLKMGANLLFDSRQIPGEIVDVLVVPQTVLESQRKQLDVLIQGWFRALDYLNKHPEDAAKRMAPRQGLNPKQFLATLELLHIPDFQENQQLLSKADPKLLNVLRKLSKLMLEKDLLKQAVQVESLLDDRLVKALP
ncbi:ABC transporter substrate-binding protein [Tolypothrix sp. FACHB-123]|uniref:ABC transporter substrate-binding protein n=1 Tax=Tolypothrix sp. FACHB-123 TaxID=2692868 RepID=UPI0016883928|nr:ABC transporter substrate-binding protein [Tolypothrix sp. FACHB-123]MBD2359507.1 ABC transporter substrate-binding protein [Tolypothrix sp. FACHB-123]